ncbi:MAG: bifunctional UDP-N-acetylglucosamine diphosphorylase/glucosamine-1-phosphate N-acetyltransferase GlmU [Bryobacter sp.]|nr:bifunctional UDP-N-acetylglucosamine diphosphorylase/glucosamine-1-phosphate N-acetyltransferase GlmU [Bryobacter sp.]
MTQDVSAIILAAGLGTRMKSRKAKVLHEAGGMALVEHVLRAASELVPGERVTVVVGHQADAVEERLRPLGCRFAEQKQQNGTGHAVAICKGIAPAEGLLLLLYGDCPLLRKATLNRLVETHRAAPAGTAATLITVELPDPTGYGRIIRGPEGEVAAIVEQKAANSVQAEIREINSGIYCVDAKLLWQYIGEITPNPASGEIYLTDLVEVFAHHGLQTRALVLEDASEILGINNRVELATADRILRERKAKQLMLDGVTILQPETVAIDMAVTIGIDTIVEPFAQIRGNTHIGENCRIGAGSILRDAVLGNQVSVGEYCIVGTSTLEDEVSIGPFSRLRQENHIEAGAHIGNFVELKKTRLGRRSKAMHLAYLGDADIGTGVNIGAGTITCNYDGKLKHRTHIGDGSFVGSNSTLVAPLELEPGCYIAAGSVITKRVKQGELGVGRSRQTNVEGWVARKA